MAANVKNYDSCLHYKQCEQQSQITSGCSLLVVLSAAEAGTATAQSACKYSIFGKSLSEIDLKSLFGSQNIGLILPPKLLPYISSQVSSERFASVVGIVPVNLL